VTFAVTVLEMMTMEAVGVALAMKEEREDLLSEVPEKNFQREAKIQLLAHLRHRKSNPSKMTDGPLSASVNLSPLHAPILNWKHFSSLKMG